jgi:hypothetical protein
MRRVAWLAGLATLGLVAAAPLAAQGTTGGETDPRWQGWVGCWRPAAPALRGEDSVAATVVCVLPAGGSAVEVATVTNGKVASRDRIDASGEARAVTRDGCAGTERAAFSPDAERVYLKAEYRCTGLAPRISEGMFSITPGGDWLSISSVTVGAGAGVQVARYREAAPPADLPAEVVAALPARSTMAAQTARLATASRATFEDVVEASKAVNPSVVQAWLVERGEGFQLDARRLAALADAGVPGNVTDVMVALSYPKVFALDRGTGRPSARETVALGEGATRRGAWTTIDPFWGWGYGYPGYYGYGWGYPGYYGYRNGYGYGYGSGLGGWYWNTPVVVVVPRDANPQGGVDRPRVVNGRGYSSGRGSDGSSGGVSRTSGSSGGASTSRDGGSASGGGSSSSGSSTGRTAHPRP